MASVISTDQIIRLASLYGAAAKVPDVTVSHRVFDDSKKLAMLKSGADITISRYTSTIQWFSNHWPDGAEWPADIVRPAPAPQAIAS